MSFEPTLSARAQRKQLALQRMQRFTAALLLASLGVLVLSLVYRSRWPWLQWLQAFAEASAIGAIADWYAVVALFRRPFGLPIPHTAIIPENKRSIGESLGEFVAQYLLTPENISRRLQQYDMAQHVARWLAVPANAARLSASLASYLPGLLRSPDDAELRRFFQSSLAPLLLELDSAAIAGRALQLLLDAGLHSALLDRALPALDEALMANEELIREKFAQASRYTPAFVDGYIVRKFIEGIRSLAHEVDSDPRHALRAQFEQALRQLTGELRHSPQHRLVLRAWLIDAVQALSNDADLRRLRDRLAASVEADIARPDSRLQHYGAMWIGALGEGALRDRAIMDRLNNAWLKIARAATIEHGGQVATLIAEVVKSWDAHEVSRKFELEIGRDLQFIRINGAVVGGTVGLMLHACALVIR